MKIRKPKTIINADNIKFEIGILRPLVNNWSINQAAATTIICAHSGLIK